MTDNLKVISNEGDEIFCYCPFCNKGKKHFSINKENGVYHCYKCNSKGNFYQLIYYLEGVPYYEINSLLQEYRENIPLYQLEKIYNEAKVKKQQSIPDWTVNTQPIAHFSSLCNQAKKYLLKRGIDMELATELGVRVGTSGRYQGMVIFPVIEDNLVVNFVARRFMGGGKRYDGPHKEEGYWKKSHLVWNLNRIPSDSSVVIVEGIFDAISLLDKNVGAILGKTITNTQMIKIAEKASEVTILMDANFTEEGLKIARTFIGFVDKVFLATMLDGDPSSNREAALESIKNKVDIDTF